MAKTNKHAKSNSQASKHANKLSNQCTLHKTKEPKTTNTNVYTQALTRTYAKSNDDNDNNGRWQWDVLSLHILNAQIHAHNPGTKKATCILLNQSICHERELECGWGNPFVLGFAVVASLLFCWILCCYNLHCQCHTHGPVSYYYVQLHVSWFWLFLCCWPHWQTTFQYKNQ